MDKINYDLDLRSAEYVASTRLIKKGAVKLFIIILLLLLPIIMLAGLQSYRGYLEQKTAALAADISALKLKVEPLIAMTAETERLNEKLKLEEKLSGSKVSWSTAMREIRSALPHTLILDSITIDSGGSVEIKGTSQEIKSPALYRQNIANLPLTGYTSLESVSMNQHRSYNFVLKTVFISTGEVAENEN